MGTTIHFAVGGGNDDIVVKTSFVDTTERYHQAKERGHAYFQVEGNRGQAIAIPVGAVLWMESRDDEGSWSVVSGPTYQSAITAARDLLESWSDGQPDSEYARGIVELIADTFGYGEATDMGEARERIYRDLGRS